MSRKHSPLPKILLAFSLSDRAVNTNTARDEAQSLINTIDVGRELRGILPKRALLWSLPTAVLYFPSNLIISMVRQKSNV